jgi:hypothetical protein
MKCYADGHVDRLNTQLKRARVAPEVVAEIMAGADAIQARTKPAEKAAWLRGAMQRLDAALDVAVVRAVREGCACCLGGKRLEISKAIARDHDTLEARIAAANEARFVFGHSVTRLPDGRIRVGFFPEGATNLRCPCLREAAEPLPISYCYCCGGHVKHHLQTALGRKVTCEVESSVLSSGGQKPCVFLLTLVEEVG